MINKKYFLVMVVLLICPLLGSYVGWSQSTDLEDTALTWQDIRELLKLDTDEIRMTWAEFQKLLAQTGNQVDIDFKDEDGIVTLTRDQFRQLLSKMKPVGKKLPLPPKDYLITEAAYSGIAGDKNSRFSATFKIYVFEREYPAYVVIPIVHTGLALRDIQVDGTPTGILTGENWHNINLAQSGYHEVKAIFSAEQGNQSISLPVVRSAINRIDFTIFDNDLEINVNPSLNATVETLINGIRFSGYVPATAQALTDRIRFSGYAPPTDQLHISWTHKTEKKAKQSALFYANTRTLLSVDADILRVTTEVALEIIRGSLDSASLLVPKNYEVVNIEGEAVSDWRVRKTGIGQVLEIPFRYEIDRMVNFTVHAERILAAESLATDFNGFQVLDARRETGNIGIIAESAVEVQAQGSQEIKKLEYHKVPQDILATSSRPVLFAFNYAKHPYQLDINITKHERMEGITTVIESAEATALFLKEGKILYHIIYTVRNTFKQFMELTLPPNASIWTVYVDNKRAKASRNEQGNVLISLVRSSGNGVKPFHVELTYTLPVDEFGLSGEGECLIPSTDIFTNRTQLSVYVPTGFQYEFDKGEWEEAPDDVLSGETEIEIPKVSSAPDGRRKLERDKPSAAQAMIGPAGLSSIKVHLPLSGDRWVFAKTIVDKHETFPLQFSYTSRTYKKGVATFIIIAVFIGLFFVLFKIRNVLKRTI